MGQEIQQMVRYLSHIQEFLLLGCFYTHSFKCTDVLFSFWDGMNQEDDSLLYLLGDQTPIRECRDVSYDISGVESNLFLLSP